MLFRCQAFRLRTFWQTCLIITLIGLKPLAAQQPAPVDSSRNWSKELAAVELDGQVEKHRWQSSTALPNDLVQRWFHTESLSLDAGFRVPGEFEHHQVLVMAAGSPDPKHARSLARIAAASSDRIQIAILVNSSAESHLIQEELEQIDEKPDSVTMVHLPHDTCWVRDFGPTGLWTEQSMKLIDWSYVQGRPADDRVPEGWAELTGTARCATPLEFEGGNLLSNGQGLILTTTKVFERNGVADQKETIARELASLLHAEDLVFLEPLLDEESGHVDMFATFTSPNTVVVGKYDSNEDSLNSAILDRNADLLAGIQTRHGPLRVERIPMDKNMAGNWRTYTNCIFANGVLIMPVYQGSRQQSVAEALQLYHRLLPGWEIVSLESTYLMETGGAVALCVAECFSASK